MQTIYEHSNVVGIDVSADLMTLAPGISPMLARYLENGTRMSPATQTKHEWFDDVIMPKSFTVDSVTGNDITFLGTIAPKKNYILNFTTNAGVLVNATARVTSVSGQVATVTVLTGTIGSVVANLKANVVSEGIEEGRTFDGGTFQSWPREHNLTEIFDDGYEMSRTLASINGLAGVNTESHQAQSALKRIAQKLTRASIYGQRTENGKVRTLGGIDYFLSVQAGANVLSVSSAPTAADFDQVVNSIIDRAWETGDLVIVLHGKWSATIRGFNARTMQVTDTTIGGAVKEYITSTGKVIPVVFDNARPQNKIYFEDMSRIGLVPLIGGQVQIGEEQKGRDGIYRPITGEYTFEIRNAKEAHGTIIIN